MFDISLLTAAGMTAGSIEGAGSHFLGGKLLTVGGNNLSTEVSGTLADGGFGGGTGGALTKVGTGTQTLSGTNTYTGATTVNAGALIVNGSIASSSGLTVNAGATVGGTGTLPSTTINRRHAFARQLDRHDHHQRQPGARGGQHLSGRSVADRGRPHQCHRHRDARRHRAADLRVRAYTINTYTILSAAGGRSGTFDRCRP